MLRSVSAPSSVTKTSPCWNGLSVPGSTFRYGSNFCRLTRSPRLSSRHPIDDAAIPLPSDETTPPVTKMYLAILNHPCQSSFKQLVHPFQVVWRVHAYGFILGFDYADLVPVLERAQLLQALGFLKRADRHIGIPHQEIAAVNIKSDVLEVDPRRRMLRGLIPGIRVGRKGTICGVFEAVG